MENTLIKLTLHDETKKRAHDSQIVRAKENLKLSHGGSSYRATVGPATDKPIRSRIFNFNKIVNDLDIDSNTPAS